MSVVPENFSQMHLITVIKASLSEEYNANNFHYIFPVHTRHRREMNFEYAEIFNSSTVQKYIFRLDYEVSQKEYQIRCLVTLKEEIKEGIGDNNTLI